MSTSRIMTGGWVNRKTMPRGQNGRGLCRWCTLEVPARRFTFCSDYCVHEWKLRSQPGYLREHIFKRDRGVCAHCAADTTARKQSRAVAKLLNLLYLCEHAPYRRRDALEHTARVIDEFLRIAG